MTAFALNNLWTYLQGLSLSQTDREWLSSKLIMPKEKTIELSATIFLWFSLLTLSKIVEKG